MPQSIVRRAFFGRGRRALALAGFLILCGAGGLSSCGRSLTSPQTGTGGASGSGSGGISLGGAGGGPLGYGGAIVCPSAMSAGGAAGGGAGLCGNGVIDVITGNGGHMGPSYSEQCDGANIPPDTACGISGTVACDADCQVDYNGCEVCEPVSPPVSSCGAAPGGARNATAVAVAATDTEIGLAWVEGGRGGATGTLRFARLSPALDLLAAFDLDNVCDNFNRGPASIPTELAVAALPSGWVVVTESDSARYLDVYALDAQGRPIARTTFPSSTDAPANPLNLMLAPRPDGAPLLAWRSGYDVRTTMVAADGRAVGLISRLPLDGVPDNPGSAAFIGDSFYVAAMVTPQNQTGGQLRIVRLTPDGGVISTAAALPGRIVLGANIIAGAADLQLVYTTQELLEGVYSFPTSWQPFDATGAPTAPALAAQGPLEPNDVTSVGGTAVIVTTSNPALNSDVGIQTITPQGQIGTAFHEISRAYVWSSGVARRGPDAIVAWLGGNKLVHIARVTP